MRKLVSVIIPVYNIENYVDDCLKSALGQTYSNLEIIVVDDGSKDRSGEICDEYARADSRVRVLHRANGGLSAARNSGIEAASGEYITFIDGDDYVDDTYVETLYGLIEGGADISICEFSYVYGDKVKRCKSKLRGKLEMTSHEALKTMLYQNYYDTSAWGKLYKRELFADGVRFPEGKLFEDMGTTYKLLLKADKVAYENISVYYYVQRNDSISNSEYNPRKNDYLEFAEEIYTTVKTEAPECIDAAASRVVSVAAHLMREMYPKGAEDKYTELRRGMYEKIKRYSKGIVLDKNVRPKNRMVFLLAHLPFAPFDFVIKKMKDKI